jgi:hypothetical protein
MKTIFGIIFGIMLLISSVKAVNPVPYTFDVQGLIVGNKYTDAEMRQKLGTPIDYKIWIDVVTGETRRYRFGTTQKYDEFKYNGDGLNGFSEFTLVNTTYSVFEGHIKVGDNITKFNQLGGGLRVLNEIVDNNHKIYHFYPIGFVSEVFLVINTDNDGKITSMWAELPV